MFAGIIQSLKAENNTIQAKLSQTVIDDITKNRYSFFCEIYDIRYTGNCFIYTLYLYVNIINHKVYIRFPYDR